MTVLVGKTTLGKTPHASKSLKFKKKLFNFYFWDCLSTEQQYAISDSTRSQ